MFCNLLPLVRLFTLYSLPARRSGMKESRYTKEQIAFALRQAETGMPMAAVIRRMGVSEQTFYR